MKETLELFQATCTPIPRPHKSSHPKATPEPLIDISLSANDFKQIFSKWNEKTTTSPSGHHLGHYKAVLQHEDICSYHAIMTLLPLIYGFSPPRWTKTIQIMLEKDRGKPLIHRLRGIVILEADFNWALCTICKCITGNLSVLHLLPCIETA